MNPLSTSTRFKLCIFSAALMITALTVPSDLSQELESFGVRLPLLASLLVAAFTIFMTLSGAFKRIPGIEAAPGIIALLTVLILVFGIHGRFELFPGTYRTIGVDWTFVWSLPFLAVALSLLVAIVSAIGPGTKSDETWLARNLVMSSFVRLSSISRPRLRKIFISTSLAAVALLTLDFTLTQFTIVGINNCVENRFRKEWYWAYYEDPWLISRELKRPVQSELPVGWQVVIIGGEPWMGRVMPFLPSHEWEDFVRSVSSEGISVSVTEFGSTRTRTYDPMAIDDADSLFGANDKAEDFTFGSFIAKLRSECEEISAPVYPVSKHAVDESPQLITSISQIKGYVEVGD